MKRVRMVLAYDGTNYCGWQLQPNGITIEEVLNQALSELLREPVVVIGASRTDSGVHAEGAVAVFDTENRMPADKICFALNQRLPEDIRVLQSDEVPLTWHPRKQNCVKTYEYRILNRKISMPTRRLYSHFCYFDMDVEKMQQAAEYLLGEHDFKSFCTVRTQAEETVRTIYSLTVTKADDLITIRISGSGFLYNMVRIIAGTLVKIGMGVYPPEKMEEILEEKNRAAAGPTIPARGLTLVSLEYEKEAGRLTVGKLHKLMNLNLSDPENVLADYISGGQKNSRIVSVDADLKTGQLKKLIYENKFVKVSLTVDEDGTRNMEEDTMDKAD